MLGNKTFAGGIPTYKQQWLCWRESHKTEELGDLTCQRFALGKTPHPLSPTCRQAGWWTQWTKAGKGFSPFLGLAWVDK